MVDVMRSKLNNLLSRLDLFVTHPDFVTYGFGSMGPYASWIASVEELIRESETVEDRVRAQALLSLGYALMLSHGQENERTTAFRNIFQHGLEAREFGCTRTEKRRIKKLVEKQIRGKK